MKKDPGYEVDLKELLKDITASSYKEALLRRGITNELLADRLHEGLFAKETKLQKLEGKLKTKDTPPFEGELKVLAKTGKQTLVAVQMDALGIQQDARKDAQKLFDYYPAERHKYEGPLEILVVDRYEEPESEDKVAV